MNYNILIVDDEALIRRGLQKLLENAGHRVVGQAANGAEALEILGKQPVDIIISDVRMPLMNGIELVKNVKSTRPGIHIIMLSGFGEFDFVRNAMKEGAEDYLLKPVSREEILDIISKIKIKPGQLNTEVMKQKFVIDCVNGTMADAGNYAEKIGLAFEPGGFSVATLRWIAKDHCGDENKPEFITRLDEQVKMNLESKAIYAKTKQNEYVFIRTNNDPEGFVNAISNITGIVCAELGISAAAGISDEGAEMNGIPELYGQSVEALNQRMFCEGQTVFLYKDRKYVGSIHDMDFSRQEREIVKYMEGANITGILHELEIILDSMKNHGIKPQDVLVYLNYLLNRMLALNTEFKDALEQKLYANYDFLEAVKELFFLEEIKQFYFKILSNAIRQMYLNRLKKDKRIIEDAKRFINENYKQNISLADVANHIERNTAYLSDLFKVETGITFTEYLTNIRIEAAKELMKDPKVKMYEIGFMVGYEEPAYFSRVFRKIVGIPPTQYREKVMN